MPFHTIQYLALSANKYPSKVAFSDKLSCITYQELWDAAQAVATAVSIRLSGAKRQPVFVCIDRTVESVVAFMGVAASGNFYVPIDPNLPNRRLEDIFRTMSPRLVITTKPDTRDLPFSNACIVPLEALRDYPADLHLVDKNISEILDTDPLYCIFTSGSTGSPKGVLVSHRSVIDMAEQFTEIFHITESTIFGNQAPFDFDVSVKDIFLAIRNGATVHVLEKQLFSLPKKLIETINDHKVNTLIWSVSAMRILSALKTLDVILPKYLCLVMFSGEVLPCKVLNDWVSHLPNVTFVNLYGPTEITCNCTYYKIDRSFSNDESIPIGKPFPNTGILLLDGSEQVVEPGKTGEICVTGSCLALGYYANVDQTLNAFCQDPLTPFWERKIYKTGDLGKWDEDGNLVFAGRADSQIKHMGFRIELSEVELAANSLPFISAACCLYDHKREQLCLFYQAKEKDNKRVVAALQQLLPKAMVPNRLYHFEKMPENRTGKIDRVALRQEYIN